MSPETSIDSAEDNGFAKSVSGFADQHYSSASAKKRLSLLRNNMEATAPMNPDCRVVIDIPCFYNEKNLGRTLRRYLNQTALDREMPFEIVVLINAPLQEASREDILASPAYSDAQEFIAELNHLKASTAPADARYRHLNVTILTGRYAQNDRRIGLIRRDLAMLSMERINDCGHHDPENVLLATQDADLIDINPDYVTNVEKIFREDERIGGLTGFIDHPQADFQSNHLFLTLQRFDDMLESIKRYKLNSIILRGGNTLFRVRDYLKTSGHGPALKAENEQIKLKLQQADPDSVRYVGKTAGIVTSGRRQIQAIMEDVPLDQRYSRFGIKGDLADSYNAPPDKYRIPEIVYSINTPGFRERLEKELQNKYEKYVHKNRGKDDSGSVPEQSNEAQVQQWFKRTAFFIGLKISFHEKTGEGKICRLQVDDISKLKELIGEKYDIS
jgi:hypothetical protein